jgi:hypothetical protein
MKFKNPARHFLVRVRLLIRNVETPGAAARLAMLRTTTLGLFSASF